MLTSNCGYIVMIRRGAYWLLCTLVIGKVKKVCMGLENNCHKTVARGRSRVNWKCEFNNEIL